MVRLNKARILMMVKDVKVGRMPINDLVTILEEYIENRPDCTSDCVHYRCVHIYPMTGKFEVGIMKCCKPSMREVK